MPVQNVFTHRLCIRAFRLRARVRIRTCVVGWCAVAGGLMASSLQAQTPRLEVIQAMLQRPNDLWPRGKGHVVLALPGCPEAAKGYHEPGGSFSPEFGSFGVAVWITDREGKVEASGDTLPLEDIRQQLVWRQHRELPAIQTETPYYRALWSFAGGGRWQLDLALKPNADRKAYLVVRSVGPAGGPVRLLDWSSGKLRINERWTIAPSPDPASVSIGDEGVENWKVSGAGLNLYTGEGGGVSARFALGDPADWPFPTRDTLSPPATPLAYSS